MDNDAILRRIEQHLAQLVEDPRQKTRDPIDRTVYISTTEWWSVDYMNRKHIFLWIPSSSGLTLSMGDYGSGLVPGLIWVNLGIQEGVRITCTSTSLQEIILRFTDEGAP